MNVYQKISAVMQDVRYLAKDDKISFGSTSYKAISEEKVTSVVRDSLVNHGLVIVPITQEHRKDGNLTTVDVTYRVQNIEDIEDFIITAASGTGADTQDKGVGKAVTYAYKYMLLRLFAIPTGEDPDKISSDELDDKQKKQAKKYEEDAKKKDDADTPKLYPSGELLVLRELAKDKGVNFSDMLKELAESGDIAGKSYKDSEGHTTISKLDALVIKSKLLGV